MAPVLVTLDDLEGHSRLQAFSTGQKQVAIAFGRRLIIMKSDTYLNTIPKLQQTAKMMTIGLALYQPCITEYGICTYRLNGLKTEDKQCLASESTLL